MAVGRLGLVGVNQDRHIAGRFLNLSHRRQVVPHRLVMETEFDRPPPLALQPRRHRRTFRGRRQLDHAGVGYHAIVTAAPHPVQRLSAGLPDQIPERDIEAGSPSVRLPSGRQQHFFRDALDVEGITTHQTRFHSYNKCGIGAGAEWFRRIGIDRVLFGTNYPMHDPAQFLAVIRAMPLDDSEREQVLWRNAAAMLERARARGLERGGRGASP